jgi:hypothetical protein
MAIEAKQLTMKEFKAHPIRAYHQYVELHNRWVAHQNSPEKRVLDGIKEIIRKEGCNACSCHECACL